MRLRRTSGPGRAALAVAAAAALAAPLLTAQPASAAPRPALSVLTTNTMLLPSFVSDSWAQNKRGELIGDAPYLKGHDVVVFQELFDNSGSANVTFRAMLNGYPHQTPVIGRSKSGWDRTSGDYKAFAPEDGGVAIASKWPITHRAQHIYDRACGSDALSEKGFAYARLSVGGSPVHVFGTHLQADDGGCDLGEARSIRASQLLELRNYVNSLNLPLNQPVIYAGDFNIDRAGSEYQTLLTRTYSGGPFFEGAPYTMDPVTNSVARKRYPKEPRQWLDYVIYDGRHNRPLIQKNQAITPTSPPWSADGELYNHYSDHYPVVSRDSGSSS
ncbi:sphingomyelin phosphodiesterase [Streptomyces sp. NPDC005805]|uniref:sphingomyelin phosphodiesterase n=1 Tax=Streptomyces sp. NPDC005805 TaxID=3157068 RepID=UPI0033F2057A